MLSKKNNEDGIEKSVPRDHPLSSLGKPRDTVTLGTDFSIPPSPHDEFI